MKDENKSYSKIYEPSKTWIFFQRYALSNSHLYILYSQNPEENSGSRPFEKRSDGGSCVHQDYQRTQHKDSDVSEHNALLRECVSSPPPIIKHKKPTSLSLSSSRFLTQFYSLRSSDPPFSLSLLSIISTLKPLRGGKRERERNGAPFCTRTQWFLQTGNSTSGIIPYLPMALYYFPTNWLFNLDFFY